MTDSASIAQAVKEFGFLTTLLQGGTVRGTPAQPRTDAPDVTILSGFLGAGKTTLLRRILSADHGRRIAVIVNDFGAVNLDAEEITDIQGDVIALTNGCSCCQLGSNFVAALERVAASSIAPDHIIVEASGMSDPVALATLAASTTVCGEARVVTLVDAGTAETLGHGPMAGLFYRQLEAAHRVVLTKLETVSKARIADLTRDLEARFPGRPIGNAAGACPLEILQGVGFGARFAPAHKAHQTSGVETRDLVPARGWSEAGLRAVLSEIPRGLLRLKGRVVLVDGRCLSVQAVGRSFELTRFESADPAPRLVAIGLKGDAGLWGPWVQQLATPR